MVRVWRSPWLIKLYLPQFKYWQEQEWNREGEKFVRSSIANHGSVDWRAVDKHRLGLLHTLLAHRGLIILHEDASTSELQVKEGSLWNESQLKHLGLVWHRLPPWPDTCRGLTLLNKKFSTVTLSNTYNDLLKSLVAHSSIPFTHVYSADMFQSFKPNPKVYLGAAEKMGVKPEECGLVAAHLSDLKGAKACGFYAIYVERPLEEKTPELREENIPDLWIKEGENGFIALAEHLGIQNDWVVISADAFNYEIPCSAASKPYVSQHLPTKLNSAPKHGIFLPFRHTAGGWSYLVRWYHMLYILNHLRPTRHFSLCSWPIASRPAYPVQPTTEDFEGRSACLWSTWKEMAWCLWSSIAFTKTAPFSRVLLLAGVPKIQCLLQPKRVCRLPLYFYPSLAVSYKSMGQTS